MGVRRDYVKPKSCKIEGCTGAGYIDRRNGSECFTKGFCTAHYAKYLRYGDPLVTKRYKGILKVTEHPLYSTFTAMKYRCSVTTHSGYELYGGRGIKVCDRWSEVNGFANFLEDMGPRPSTKHTLDRIEIDGDYCPENCRWATIHTQNSNKRNNNPIVGVFFQNKRNKWYAFICVDKKQHFLGRFQDKNDAIAARESAEKRFGITYSPK